MRLNILCKHGKYPAADGGTSSFLIEGGGATVVLDMGSGAAIELERLTSLENIDAVILSHLHYDHICDLFALVYKCKIFYDSGRIEKKLRVYLPSAPCDIYGLIKKTDAFDLRPIEPFSTVNIKGLELSFIPMTHPVETYGIRMNSDGVSMAYTADTTFNRNIEGLVSGCKYVFADACLLQKDQTPKSPHISVAEIAKLIDEALSRAVLIHLPHTDREQAAVLTEARSVNKSAELGVTGKWYC